MGFSSIINICMGQAFNAKVEMAHVEVLKSVYLIHESNSSAYLLARRF